MDTIIRNTFLVILCLLLGGIIGSKVTENKQKETKPNLIVVVSAYKGGELMSFDYKSFEFQSLSELTKVRGEFQSLTSDYVKVNTFIYYK